ncbi:hypothetical protein ACJX0J_032821, partial [Zea mays]
MEMCLMCFWFYAGGVYIFVSLVIIHAIVFHVCFTYIFSCLGYILLACTIAPGLQPHFDFCNICSIWDLSNIKQSLFSKLDLIDLLYSTSFNFI